LDGEITIKRSLQAVGGKPGGASRYPLEERHIGVLLKTIEDEAAAHSAPNSRSTRITNGDIRDSTNLNPSGSYRMAAVCTRSILLSVAPDTVTTEEGRRLELEY
jgi:hypothetical protein